MVHPVLITATVGGRGRSHVLVRCDCGTETEAGVTNLRRGNTQSCGCMVREATIARSTTHGATATRLYRIWRGMRKRCSTDHDIGHVMKPAPTPRWAINDEIRERVTQIKDAVSMRLEDNGGEPSMA